MSVPAVTPSLSSRAARLLGPDPCPPRGEVARVGRSRWGSLAAPPGGHLAPRTLLARPVGAEDGGGREPTH